MSKPRLIQKSDIVYLVSNRCIDGKAFFKVCDEVKTIIERTLAWAVDVHSVLVYAYMFELNQFEMAVRAPQLNLQDFMRDFQSVIAREIKTFIGRTERGFFAAPYEPEPIIDDECVADEIARLLCRPCEAGLVEHPRDWPGASSWTLHETGGALIHDREDRRIFHRLKQQYPDMSDAEASDRATTTYRLELTRPPTRNHRSSRGELQVGVQDRVGVRDGGSHDVLGARAVREWPPLEHMPHSIPKRPRRCVAATPRRRRRFSERRRDANLYYDWARKRLRRGLPDPTFPFGMIPPHKTRAVGASDTPRAPTRRPPESPSRPPPS